jgi:ketosteroid isomerase-like protein
MAAGDLGRGCGWVALVLLAGAAAACTRKPPVRQPPPPEDTGPASDDRAALEKDLATSIRESYQALSDGYEEAYLESLARDKRLVLIDVGPEDVLVGYDTTACQLRRQFLDEPAQFVSKALEVHVSDDGTAGWSYDEISYRVLHEGRRVIIPLRATAAYERRGGRWLLVQQHVSYALTDDELWTDAAEGQLTAPAALGDWTAPGDDALAVRDVVEHMVNDTDDTRAKHIIDDDRLLVVGPEPDLELRGKAAVDRATVRALFGYDNQVRLRDLRVKASATGTVAWAAANIVVDNGKDGGEHATLPLRATWVLEKKGGVWRVVQLHVSAGITQQQLALKAFGSTEL